MLCCAAVLGGFFFLSPLGSLILYAYISVPLRILRSTSNERRAAALVHKERKRRRAEKKKKKKTEKDINYISSFSSFFFFSFALSNAGPLSLSFSSRLKNWGVRKAFLFQREYSPQDFSFLDRTDRKSVLCVCVPDPPLYLVSPCGSLSLLLPNEDEGKSRCNANDVGVGLYQQDGSVQLVNDPAAVAARTDLCDDFPLQFLLTGTKRLNMPTI